MKVKFVLGVYILWHQKIKVNSWLRHGVGSEGHAENTN